LAAAARGGGMALAGDFLFGEADRYTQKMWKTAAGPVASDAMEIMQMTNEALHGKGDIGDWVKFLYSHAPNLWMTRVLFNQMIAYKTYEALSPGYTQRMMNRMRKENGQEFYISPR